MSQSDRPSTPIIEDWVSDSEDESKGDGLWLMGYLIGECALLTPCLAGLWDGDESSLHNADDFPSLHGYLQAFEPFSSHSNHNL
nr:hypothetical protein [Tanacetum cinerariifolium]